MMTVFYTASAQYPKSKSDRNGSREQKHLNEFNHGTDRFLCKPCLVSRG